MATAKRIRHVELVIVWQLQREKEEEESEGRARVDVENERETRSMRGMNTRAIVGSGR